MLIVPGIVKNRFWQQIVFMKYFDGFNPVMETLADVHYFYTYRFSGIVKSRFWQQVVFMKYFDGPIMKPLAHLHY